LEIVHEEKKGACPIFHWSRASPSTATAACRLPAIRHKEEADVARKNRYAPAGFAHHVVNRGNDRQRIFHETLDYVRFIELLAEGASKSLVKVYGYCLMPNHFHLLVEPLHDDALSAFMQPLECSYACYFRRRTGTVGHGHVVQRRFWNAAARNESAFLANLRYIEANPVRADLVVHADLWPWSSFSERAVGGRKILTPLPLVLPSNWTDLVNQPQPPATLDAIRRALVRCSGRPRRDDGRQDAVDPDVIDGAKEMGQAPFRPHSNRREQGEETAT
jgi:putative transposase